MFLLASKFKMVEQKDITKKTVRLHNHSTLLTIVQVTHLLIKYKLLHKQFPRKISDCD